MKKLTVFEQANDNKEVKHEILQFLASKPCQGTLYPEDIYSMGRVIDRRWVCDTCSEELSEYKLIEISDDIDYDNEIDNHDYDRDYSVVDNYYDGR